MEFEIDSDHFDQHFLIDQKVINNFMNFSDISKEDIVVEIGPGKGVITKELAKRAKEVICIELDVRLKPYLDKIEDENNNVSVVYKSALDAFIPKCDKIITSLPYSIVEPFIEKLIRCSFKEAILITGNKFATSVRDNELNRLSLLTNSFFNIEYLEEILPESFDPAPRVLSAIIKLTPKPKGELQNDFNKYMIRELFFNRSKKIKNNLVDSYINYHKLHNKVVTQKEAKSLLDDSLNNILDKNMSNISSEDIKLIIEFLNKIK